MFSDVNSTRDAHMRHVNVPVLMNQSHRAWERKNLLNHLLWIASHGTVSKERETCWCTTDLLSMIHFLWKITIKPHQFQCPSIGKSKWEQLLKVSWWCLERLGIAGVTNLLCKEKLWSVVQQGHFQGGDHWNTRWKAVGRCHGQTQYSGRAVKHMLRVAAIVQIISVALDHLLKTRGPVLIDFCTAHIMGTRVCLPGVHFYCFHFHFPMY